MKRTSASTAKKTTKKPNIPLRRKITILYGRLILASKIGLLILLDVLFFTKYLQPLKQELASHIFETTAEIGFKLENVVIEGCHHIMQEDILPVLNADTGTPIFSININEVRNLLQKNPWIKTAAVERQLPSTIYISLLERKPIAIWQVNQKLYLIDEEGFNITNKNIEKFSNLPHVVGADANVYAAKLISDLARSQVLTKRLVSAVRYGERRWNLNFEQNLTVKMPETNFNNALDYLIALCDAHKLFDQNYKSLDLRDAQKYYIEKFQ